MKNVGSQLAAYQQTMTLNSINKFHNIYAFVHLLNCISKKGAIPLVLQDLDLKDAEETGFRPTSVDGSSQNTFFTAAVSFSKCKGYRTTA